MLFFLQEYRKIRKRKDKNKMSTKAQLTEQLQQALEEVEYWKKSYYSAKDTRYNGWSNYETWNVALWLDNDFDMWSELSESCNDGTYEDVNELADYLENFIDEMNPVLNDASMFSDLLSSSFREVNYREIAEHYWNEYHTNDNNEDEE